MRYTLSFIIFFFFLEISSASTTYLSFNIEEAIKKDIKIQVRKENSEAFLMYNIQLNEENQVTSAFDLKSSQFVNITYNNKEFILFIEPSDDFTVSFNANNFINSIAFKGKGAENNILLYEYKKLLPQEKTWEYTNAHLSTQIPLSLYKKAGFDSPSTYYKELEKNHLSLLEKVQVLKDNNNAHQSIISYINKDLEYNNETHKIAYLIINKDKMGPGDYTRLAEHYKVQKSVNFLSDEIMHHPAYLNYAIAYAHYLFLPNFDESKADELMYYNNIDKNMGGQTRYFLLYQLLKQVYFEEGTADLAMKKYAKYKKDCPYPQYIEELDNIYKHILLDIPEVDAPNFTFYDESGNIKSLDSYKGQVVYISFWAHWCKPCINGFKKSGPLRAELKKMGVVLLNVSIDEDDYLWKNAMEQHDIKGINVRGNDIPELKQLYQLNTIPAYFIINKNGKFAYLSDEANRDVKAEFQDLINE